MIEISIWGWGIVLVFALLGIYISERSSR